MTIGIVVGLRAEARYARPLGGMVAIGGGDYAGALRAAEHLIRNGARGLISFGLAGGLDPALHPGDLLAPDQVVAVGTHYVCDAVLRAALRIPRASSLLGAETPACSAAEKAALHQQSGCAAIDMESGAVALLAARNGLPFAVLRAICDPATRDLPEAALIALNVKGGIAGLRMAASLMRQPGQIVPLLQLAQDARLASQALRQQARRLGVLAPVGS